MPASAPVGIKAHMKGTPMHALVAAVLAVGFIGCQPSGDKNVKLETQKDKISYAIGLNVGNSLKKDSISLNSDAFLRGLQDASADSSKRLMTDKEIQETMMAFQDSMRTKQAETAKAAGEKNKAEGEAFLAENAKKPGVVTLPSGLQYKVITEGKGKKPSATSTVTTNYRGKLLNGTEFDSSFKRGQPASFPCNGVIRGWTEALQLMSVGSTWELYVPASLAYGENGAGGVIPPNATLIFEVELLSIQ
jgi:FKBP-type peptidyl-prolyl cis-trans isomerase FklB